MKKRKKGTKVRILWNKIPDKWRKLYLIGFKRRPVFGFIADRECYSSDYYNLRTATGKEIGQLYRTEFTIVRKKK